MEKNFINPPELFSSVPYGFSQVIACKGGKTVYISGQTAWDAEKRIIGANLQDQTRQTLRNLQTGVRSAGGELSDIVSMRIYVVGQDAGTVASVGEVIREFFPGDRPPTSTWLGVSSLAVSDFLIEIEAVAVIMDIA